MQVSTVRIGVKAQLTGTDLSRRSQFIEPFLIACSSKNSKYAGTGISCLQRLAVSSGLPKARLKEVLEVVRECSGLGGKLFATYCTVRLTLFQALIFSSKYFRYSHHCCKTIQMICVAHCSLRYSKPVQYCKTQKHRLSAAQQQLLCNSLFRQRLRDLPSRIVRRLYAFLEDSALISL